MAHVKEELLEAMDKADPRHVGTVLGACALMGQPGGASTCLCLITCLA